MEVKLGYKQTEVGVIPEEWEVKSLGEIATFLSGGTPSRSNDDYWTGDIPWISAKSLRCFYIFRSNSNVTRKAVAAGSKMAPLGSTLLLVRGSALHNEILSGLVTEPVCFNQDVKALVPNSQIAPKYLTFVMLGMADALLKLVSSAGNTAGVLDTKLLKAFRVFLPSLPEQRAIATALSDVDGLLGGLDRLIAKKRDLKQAAMQQLLTGQTRLPGFHGEWEVKRLGDVVQIKKGQLITSSTLMSGDIPVIAGGKQPAYFHASANRFGRTVTISASGASAGYVALYNEPIFASDCSTISEAEYYCLDFIFYQLLCKQQTIYKAQTGGAQPHIHAKDLNPILFPFPPLPEQTAIAAVLSDMDAELAAQEQRRDKTRALKQAMMQELLTGRTRLVSPDAETKTEVQR